MPRKPKSPPPAKRGRPALPLGERRCPIDVTLLQRDIDLAEVIGNGNRSKGIELALRAYLERT